MSDSTLRIAIVAEGITDYSVIRGAITSMLGDRSFILNLLQPEESWAFTGAGDAGALGGGWKGVYKWCLQSRERGAGRLSGDPLYFTYDLLILHLDADVAGKDPAGDTVSPIPLLRGILPCEKPCPPPSDTTDALRNVLLSWTGERQIPANTVFCTPSKNTEAWIMYLFFPLDRDMNRKGWECCPNPEARLQQQPKKYRFAKSYNNYRSRENNISKGWPKLADTLTEANRFQRDFLQIV
jgi:hypothetical protein